MNKVAIVYWSSTGNTETLAVFVLGRLLSVQGGGPAPDGAAAPFHLSAFGLDRPPFAGDLYAAPAGALWAADGLERPALNKKPLTTCPPGGIMLMLVINN